MTENVPQVCIEEEIRYLKQRVAFLESENVQQSVIISKLRNQICRLGYFEDAPAEAPAQLLMDPQ